MRPDEPELVAFYPPRRIMTNYKMLHSCYNGLDIVPSRKWYNVMQADDEGGQLT